MLNLKDTYDNIVLAVGKTTKDPILAYNTADALFVSKADKLAKEGKKKESLKHIKTMFENTLGVY